MAKNLKTSVQLDTSKAVKNLDNLEKKIRDVQRAIDNQAKVTNKLNGVNNKLNTTNNKVASSTNKVTSAQKKQSSAVSMLTTKVRRLANAYLGVMGASAMITSADTITKAENKLNNLQGGNPQATQIAMDKMFTSSQNARTGYADMMSNVSKSMMLAGEAFGDNIDNAIRFQEIMAKSYSIGGASATEQSSSMYQLIQALGSGILQGDELRSVREGAPLAYKEIEKFAQGIYGAEENLKDLASQGKITSDIVVAAIMSAGDQIDEKFENTAMTFEQAWTHIKNVALKSFEPVLQMLNDALNSAAGEAIINGIGKAMQFVAGVLQITFTWIGKIYSFVVDNWELIKNIFLTVATIIAVALIPKLVAVITCQAIMAARWIYTGAVAVASAIKAAAAWAIANWQFALILVVLAAVVIAIIWVADSFVDACGIIAGSAAWLVAWLINGFIGIINIVIGLGKTVGAVAEAIGIAFTNAWYSAKASFWEWVSECLNGTSLIAKAVSKIASIFGLDEVSIDTKISDAKSKIVSDYKLNSDDINSYFNTLDYIDAGKWYDTAYDWGASKGQWVTDKLGGAKDWLSNKLNLGGLPSGALDTGGIDDLVNGVKGIGDDTGSIADSMELTQEDLEYLRKIADMEWKKEFTTATIQVDMSNYNTVNGDSDLDGIVTRLTDKLYEELNSVANGVYA